jgi:hypothetical protein
MIDGVARPGLAQDLHHLVAAAIAERAVGLLARKIRRDHVQRQPALQHVVQRGHRARQHDRVQLAAADRRQQVDPVW